MNLQCQRIAQTPSIGPYNLHLSYPKLQRRLIFCVTKSQEQKQPGPGEFQVDSKSTAASPEPKLLYIQTFISHKIQLLIKLRKYFELKVEGYHRLMSILSQFCSWFEIYRTSVLAAWVKEARMGAR